MGSLKWPLFFVYLCFKAVQTEASSWTVHVPSSVKGLPGSCVVIPCSFNYPDPGKVVTKFTGIWRDTTDHPIYHPVESEMSPQYRNRAKLLGDVTQKNCSLKIDPLHQSDSGPFYFRIEMEGYEKFSYKEHKVSIAMMTVQTEASSWTVHVPSSVKGLPGSCVVIPCSFNYPDPGKVVTKFTGIWRDTTDHPIYHPVESKMLQQYRNRTKLLGDVTQKNCSLKIDPLHQSDSGPFYFRIEMEGYEKFSYKEHKASIAMMNEPSPITFSVTAEEAEEDQIVYASCSVSHSCPASPPVFTWSHSGGNHNQSQQLENGQWRATSTLSFQATSADHNKPLKCTVTYKGGRHHNTSKVLKVKYAPVNVTVAYKADVKEGEAVQLECSSDAHPSASTYEWYKKDGVQLHEGKIYLLPNVSRHDTTALYCTAKNEIGQGKSKSVQLNVLYAPEINVMSSCSSEAHMVKCVCIVKSKPPSMVHFVLPEHRVLHNATKTEKHGTITIGNLLAELGSSEFVLCLASNTQGNANLTLYLPVDSKMHSLYIIVTAGAGGILIILLISVGAVKKCRGRPEIAETPHMSTMKANEKKDVALSQYTEGKRERTYDDVQCSDIYASDYVYGNMEIDCDDEIYANV